MSPWADADAAVVEAIAHRRTTVGRSLVVALAGAQGSGKSTMGRRVAARLEYRGLQTALLALDDFYLTRAERAELARTVHPLLATRGAPGTHDISLMSRSIDALVSGASVAVPRFDKAADDRAAWHELPGARDVVLCEGWCLGARPQQPAELAGPINALERDEDPDGRWRTWVNGRLADDYAALFARFDLTIMLRAPSFEVVRGWRGEQEDDLARRTGQRGLDDDQMARFVMHYERITRAMLTEPPADLVIALDENRTPIL